MIDTLPYGYVTLFFTSLLLLSVHVPLLNLKIENKIEKTLNFLYIPVFFICFTLYSGFSFLNLEENWFVKKYWIKLNFDASNTTLLVNFETCIYQRAFCSMQCVMSIRKFVSLLGLSKYFSKHLFFISVLYFGE